MVDHKRSSVEYRVMTENTVVIKLSGKALDGQKELGELFAAAHSSRVVIVHGGGVEVDSLFKDLNLKVEKKNGLRVSPKEHMPFISAALCGMCNKKLQALAVKNGLKAIGMIASDGNSLGVEQLSADLGMVGKVSPVSADYINMLLDGGYTPVIASVAFDSEGQMYNVNADDVASAIGLLLSAPVYFISDVPGVLDKEGKLIPSLNEAQLESLIADGTISGGMQVKVKSAVETARFIGKPVYIASFKDPLLKEIVSSRHRLGTAIEL